MLDQKRLFDLMGASFLLLLALPISILTYPFLLWLLGKPVIFRQKRLGKKEQVFTMYKLRSMKKNALSSQKKYLQRNEAPWPMFKISDDPRFVQKEINFFNHKKQIPIGKFLSNSGLDELPQLINVLRGEMSLIGPRPLPVAEALALKSKDPSWYKWRHQDLPGIFSLWALDPQHNKSLTHWKNLEKMSVTTTLRDEVYLIGKIILKQLKTIFKFKI